MVDCEGILLGRESIQGTANAAALACLMKRLIRKSNHSDNNLNNRKYLIKCNKENGIEFILLDDEGFESDEDITSLNSYDDNTSSSSLYVVDHAFKTSSSLKQNNKKCSSQNLSEKTIIIAPSCATSATDSANSSGSSDNDETESSLSHNSINKTEGKSSNEKYLFNEIAFCHTDASIMSNIVVWVVKTRRKSIKNINEYTYGLEAIVFQCKNEQKCKLICKHFQELSRRIKLDKSITRQTTTRWKIEEINNEKNNKPIVINDEKNKQVINEGKKLQEIEYQRNTLKKSNENKYNLIQRIDTNGVTHIEVALRSNNEKNSINSKNQIESVIYTVEPPERPERKKDKKNTEKVIKGQYVSISVDQQRIPSSPVSSKAARLFGSEAKPCGNVLSYPVYPSWSEVSKTIEPITRKGGRSPQMSAIHNNRSKSTGYRNEKQQLYMNCNEPLITPNNSFPNRFFGKIKKLTVGSSNNQTVSGNKFRRRSSIGDLTSSHFYQHFQTKPLTKSNQPLAKSTPNLKSVIKNKNGKIQKDGFSDEPKKVTFSAYATVQVVD